ncbi:hypothetical protein BX600DRAFT_468614 [Xylariales sp. PMI_506]|nr:hypothetical protein BX600DRAFT_468614 [Xylariales sp. PMI_506]
MLSLVSCPNEILNLIFSNLNPFDLEAVGETFNRRLYHAVRPLLEQNRWWVSNARRMCAKFAPSKGDTFMPSFPGRLPPFSAALDSDELSGESYSSAGVDPTGGPYIRSSPPDLRSWMSLDGSFGWLLPLEEDIACQMEPHNGVEGTRPVASEVKIKALVTTAKDLGLNLPAGFETFLQSDRLHLRIPSYCAWFFELSDIIKAPSIVDGGAGGYIVRFHFDQQCCAFSYLYLDNEGGHCVLMSCVDLYAEEDAEADLEGEEACEEQGEIFLVGLTFEEYLATVYYEELLKFQAKPFTGLKNYVRHVYRSTAEVDQLHDTSMYLSGGPNNRI